jgi:protein-tyrosine phosphatase
MRKLVSEAKLDHAIEVESAGTAAYHVGERPDPRSRQEASRRGVELESHASQFNALDFDRFDYVLAMDSENLANLESITKGSDQHTKLSLLRSFDSAEPRDRDVPDPYYGGPDGFANVYDICESACRGLILKITIDHSLTEP